MAHSRLQVLANHLVPPAGDGGSSPLRVTQVSRQFMPCPAPCETQASREWRVAEKFKKLFLLPSPQVAMAARSPITTHVLDTSLGGPARGIPVELSSLSEDGRWSHVARGWGGNLKKETGGEDIRIGARTYRKLENFRSEIFRVMHFQVKKCSLLILVYYTNIHCINFSS